MRVRTQPSLAVATPSDSPAIDPGRGAVGGRGRGQPLTRQLGSDSIVAMVLEQAQRELNSLAASSAPATDGVFGPVRLRVAA